ncbi:PROTEIN putative-RELATED [Salix purpurea]|uniref:PROTEIN putative-RELATED n=1 Tax=Salix purpurea TaxID=77065 RepID=A0A9Q0QFW5_SALPP|nr:PROTEIN putative-RELATED [Salix purpurea]
MQRQSLGSPVTKLHANGGADTLSSSDIKLVYKDLPSSSLTPDDDDLDHKSIKPRRFSSSSTSPLSSVLSSPPPAPEKLIHLIPFLTVFCFLVLFLVSHNPSQSDLAQFNGFKRVSNHIGIMQFELIYSLFLPFPFTLFFFFFGVVIVEEAIESVDDVSGLSSVRRGNLLAIRSFRNLQEIAADKRASLKVRSHRKFAHF